MSSERQLLLEMGFSEAKADQAISATEGKGLEAAMEWILAHQDDDVPAEKVAPNEAPVPTEKLAEESEKKPDGDKPAGEADASAKSFKCDECGKLFRTELEVEYHAVKSKHQSFSETSEEIAALTPEQRAEQKRKLEERIRQRRLEREEKEKQEEVEREKNRRRVGQEIALARQKVQEQEMKVEAEKRRKEKIEDQLARKKILEEIERDKAARRAAAASANNNTSAAAPPPAPVTVAPPSQANYDQTRLQIRLTNGAALTQTFKADETLAAVRVYVDVNRSDGDVPYQLMTSFPRRVFQDEDMPKSLKDLGLLPSAVLILSKKAPPSDF